MELTKDTYLYLTKFADDRTILNMLSVNKKFNDEQFFEEVMRNKYPLLIKFKKPEEGWKQFFVGMVYCISKINEDHGISYYPVDGYNPKEYCNFSSKKNILNDIMILAAKSGNLDVIKTLMIQHDPTDFNIAMEMASKGGYIDIVKLMIEEGLDNFNEAMAMAAEGGHIDIVRLMIQHGANNFEYASFLAGLDGHQDIVDYLEQFV